MYKYSFKAALDLIISVYERRNLPKLTKKKWQTLGRESAVWCRFANFDLSKFNFFWLDTMKHKSQVIEAFKFGHISYCNIQFTSPVFN